MELRVLAGGALTLTMEELASRHMREGGSRIVYFFGTTPQLIAEAISGRPFDLGIVPVDVMRDAGARARFEPGPTTDIVRVGVGVAVRAGAPRPAIGTAAELRATLLAAQSVSLIPASATGTYVLSVFDRLGIAEEMRPKLRPQPNTAAIPAAVASGEAQIAVFLMNVISAPGVDVVGPFPPELQQNIVFTGAIASGATNASAARRFLDYVRSPEAVEVFRARGLTPG
jgi:molybdate transport system substrate-binding protein